MTSSNEMQVHIRATSLVAGAWENLALTFYRAPPTRQDVLDADAINDKLIASHGPAYSLLVFVDPAQKLPTADVRKVSAEILVKRADTQKMTVVILEGDGFWASAMRMAITSIMAIMAGRGNRRFCTNVDEAAAILVQYVRKADGSPVTPAEIASAVRDFRKAC
jgi:hypothetical protein